MNRAVLPWEALRERLRTRSAALLLVGLVHVGLLTALAFSSFSRHGGTTSEPVMTLMYLDERRPPVPSRDTQLQRSEARRLRVPVETQPVQSPPPENAITVAPIDWSDEARHASETTLARQEKDRALRSFDFPKDMGPPPAARREHVYGDIEHFEAGETIMWINSRCYYTSRALADFAAHTGPGPPPMAADQRVCKHR